MPTTPITIKHFAPHARADLALELTARNLPGVPVRVVAPERGTVLYIGPGDEVPWDGNGPGAIVIIGERATGTGPRYLHVLGYLDRESLENYWRKKRKDWGYTEPSQSQSTAEKWIIGPIGDWIDPPSDTTPRPKVQEGEQVAFVAPARGLLRWQIWRAGSDWGDVWDSLEAIATRQTEPANVGAVVLEKMIELGWQRVDPLRWLDDHGLPLPTVKPAPAPAPAKKHDHAALVVVAVVGAALVLRRRKRRRR